MPAEKAPTFSNLNDTIVRLRVVCVAPPDPGEYDATFGLQDKQGRLHPRTPDAGGDVRFDLEVQARWDTGRRAFRFRGPFVHGTPDAPFLYLSWRLHNPEEGKGEGPLPPFPPKESGAWLRRSKVSLAPITRDQVEQASRRERSGLEIRVPGKGADGGPASGSVTPLDDGWTVRDLPDFAPISPDSPSLHERG